MFSRFTKVVLLSSVILAISACQTTPLTKEDKSISNTYDVQGANKKDLYHNVNVWMAENYNSSKEVIQYSNEEKGVIVGKGNIRYPCDGFSCLGKSNWRVHYTMKVDVKDGKFRTSFDNLELSWPASYSGGISSPAYQGPVHNKSDYDLIRPILLEQGKGIKDSLTNEKAESDW
jgi:hypothetical protein